MREGDVVLVTGAAGAVGTLAGQIARLLGASRVIGTTSSEWKARRLVSELGYDAVVLRGEPLAEQLADAAPDGIDVVLDNVGGEQLIAALEVARRRARIVLVGALSGQDPPPTCGSPRNCGGFIDVIDRRLSALDEEIHRLTHMRAELARRAYGVDHELSDRQM